MPGDGDCQCCLHEDNNKPNRCFPKMRLEIEKAVVHYLFVQITEKDKNLLQLIKPYNVGFIEATICFLSYGFFLVKL